MIQHLPLYRKNCFLHSRGFDERGWRGGKPGEWPFGNAVRSVDGRGVSSFDEVLRDDVDGAFVGGEEVGEGVFGVGEAASEPDCQEWGVVVYKRSVGERGEVGGLAYEWVRCH